MTTPRKPARRRPRTTRRRPRTTRRARARTRATHQARAKPRLKNPRGGLTTAGRRAFARKDGSHLKPGVKKSERDMSPQEMKRKGSWAARFYGRAGKLPPLVDAHGKPTRFARTAAAWGEPVPRTAAAARKIAAKGRRLLAKYHAHARPHADQK